MNESIVKIKYFTKKETIILTRIDLKQNDFLNNVDLLTCTYFQVIVFTPKDDI